MHLWTSRWVTWSYSEADSYSMDDVLLGRVYGQQMDQLFIRPFDYYYKQDHPGVIFNNMKERRERGQ